jgi:hypothetical protein
LALRQYETSQHTTTKIPGLLILQYCIGIACIANTVYSIAKVLQYIFKIYIAIGIANNFSDIG